MNDDQDVIATTTTQFDSNVDLIDAADVPVTVTTTVAEAVAAKKGKRVNLATINTSLKGLTAEDLKRVTPLDINEFSQEATRILSTFKSIAGFE
jgi:hypothetical protein